jgi:peptidoglycan-N-acetylglucosamine deacetylase
MATGRRALWWLLAVSAALTLTVAGVYLAGRFSHAGPDVEAAGPAATRGVTTNGSDTGRRAPNESPCDTAPAPVPRPTTPIEPPAPTEPPPAPPPPREFQLPPSLVGTEWNVLPTTRKVVALTFDCGANAAGVPSILRTLRATGTPATFFLTGTWSEAFEKDAGEIGARYPVGNHTYSHPDLTGLASSAVAAEVEKAERIIRRTTVRDPRPLFRFPYGARNDRVIGVINELEYGSIRWTVDTLGWKGTAGGQSAESVRARVLSTLRPGAIVLMHVGSAPDGSTLDADALPSIIKAVRARGYRFVDLTGFLAAD